MVFEYIRGNGNNNGKPGNGHGNGNNGNNGNGNKPTTTPDPVEPEPVDPDPDVPETPDTPEPGNNGNGNGNNGNNGNDGNGNSAGNNGQGNGNNASNGDGNGSINKTSTVVKNFVVDYNTETFEPLMEHEVNGLDYKYVYGNDRLSVDISPINNSMSIVENGDHIRLYYHMDYLGSADYLTSPVSGRVETWTHYNEWGLIVHNAVLKCGQRELDLVKRYATHDFDSVLELYYAKARFYDAHDRRFTAVDPILDPSQYDLREYVQNPVQLVQYLYVENGPLTKVDLLGTITFGIGGEGAAAFLARVAGGGQLVFDTKGHVGIMVYIGAGGGFPSLSGSGTFTATNAPSIGDLAFWGVAGGGSATIPVGIFAGAGLGFEVMSTGQYFGVTTSLGVSTSLPEAHGELTFSGIIDITGILKFFGLYDDAN